MLGQSQSLIMGFSQGADASPTKAATKQEDRQTCLPVTIRVIEGALEQSVFQAGDELRIHGAEHGMLVLVARVEELQKQAASAEFTLCDGTGRVKGRYYMTDRKPADLEELEVGRYVSAFGNMRTSPSPHFVMTGIRLVRSADEISYHMIECAHAALKLQRGVMEPSTPSPKKITTTPMIQTPAEKTAVPAMQVPVTQSSTPVKAATVLEGAALKRAVLAFLRQDADSHPEGSSLDSLVTHLKPTPDDQSRKMLEQLIDDGEVFTTIDDEHFSIV